VDYKSVNVKESALMGKLNYHPFSFIINAIHWIKADPNKILIFNKGK